MEICFYLCLSETGKISISNVHPTCSFDESSFNHFSKSYNIENQSQDQNFLISLQDDLTRFIANLKKDNYRYFGLEGSSSSSSSSASLSSGSRASSNSRLNLLQSITEDSFTKTFIDKVFATKDFESNRSDHKDTLDNTVLDSGTLKIESISELDFKVNLFGVTYKFAKTPDKIKRFLMIRKGYHYLRSFKAVGSIMMDGNIVSTRARIFSLTVDQLWEKTPYLLQMNRMKCMT